MANVIIGIHGLANKPTKDTLADWWEMALREGLTKNCEDDTGDFQFVMVFWADLIHKPLQPSEGHTQPYIEAPEGPLEEHKDNWRDKWRARAQAAIGSVIDRTRGFLPWGLIINPILRQKFRDLDFYYDRTRMIENRAGQQEVARKVLMDELRQAVVDHRGDRLMLIAHSMGCIIAYDVLRDLGQEYPDFEVHHFVTIGSPLGLSTVKANINRERHYTDVRVRTPTVVRERWVNYADRFDPVAVDTHLRDDYEPNKYGVQVEDDIVDNGYVDVNGGRNRHKSMGYLRTPELSKHINGFLAESGH